MAWSSQESHLKTGFGEMQFARSRPGWLQTRSATTSILGEGGGGCKPLSQYDAGQLDALPLTYGTVANNGVADTVTPPRTSGSATGGYATNRVWIFGWQPKAVEEPRSYPAPSAQYNPDRLSVNHR